MKNALSETNFSDLQLVKKGKVRDIYDLGQHYLMVATDRISAFDVIMPNPIPDKGKVLNQISLFWFDLFASIVDNHIVASDVAEFPSECRKYADRSRPEYDDGQPVSLLICDESPMGFNAIVNNQYLGLLYHSEISFPIQIGERIEGYIKTIRPSGKIDLTLNQSGYGRVTSLWEDILEALNHSDGYLDIGDKSPPEKIRAQFGVSKKAFKQALGALYRQRKITFEGGGIRLVDQNQTNR